MDRGFSYPVIAGGVAAYPVSEYGEVIYWLEPPIGAADPLFDPSDADNALVNVGGLGLFSAVTLDLDANGRMAGGGTWSSILQITPPARTVGDRRRFTWKMDIPATPTNEAGCQFRFNQQDSQNYWAVTFKRVNSTSLQLSLSQVDAAVWTSRGSTNVGGYTNRVELFVDDMGDTVVANIHQAGDVNANFATSLYYSVASRPYKSALTCRWLNVGVVDTTNVKWQGWKVEDL